MLQFKGCANDNRMRITCGVTNRLEMFAHPQFTYYPPHGLVVSEPPGVFVVRVSKMPCGMQLNVDCSLVNYAAKYNIDYKHKTQVGYTVVELFNDCFNGTMKTR